jgi:hypothetical protein
MACQASHHIRRSLAIISILVFVACFSSPLIAAPPLVDLLPMPIPNSMEEIPKVVGEFPHAPIDSAGCWLLSLPFQYSTDQPSYDSSEANAFSFLISADMDWIPQNYCDRHAYFIFEHEPVPMRSLAVAYEGELIATEMRKWGATSAVGGELHRTKAGVGGTLEIFDRAGKSYFSKSYSPRDYFQLLGDMDLDVMHQVGFDPPATLAQYLREPRCQHLESIAAIGRAAFLPWGKMLDRFPPVLSNDPTFCEAYVWWAVIYGWTTNFTPEVEQQVVLAMSGRVSEQAVTEFFPQPGTDDQTIALYRKFVDRAAAIVGEDSLPIVTARLKLAAREDHIDPALMDRALALASRFPNQGILLGAIDGALLDSCDVDARRGGAIAWVDDNSRSWPGTGDKSPSLQETAFALNMLGRPDLACCALQQYTDRSDPTDQLRRKMDCLLQAMRPQDALDAYDAASITHDDKGTDAAALALVAAGLTNNRSEIDQISREWSVEFEKDGLAPVIDNFTNAAAGTPMTRHAFLRLDKVDHGLPAQSGILLSALADLASGTQLDRLYLYSLMDQHPSNRLIWAFVDAYIQRTGRPVTNVFYPGLAWMFPDDPWVKQAVERFKSHPPATQPAIRNLDKMLTLQESTLSDLEKLDAQGKLDSDAVYAAMSHDLYPLALAESVHHLLETNQQDAAHKLALRYHAVAQKYWSPDFREWATRLVQMSE